MMESRLVIDGGSDVWVRYENTPQTTRMPSKAFEGVWDCHPIV